MKRTAAILAPLFVLLAFALASAAVVFSQQAPAKPAAAAAAPEPTELQKTQIENIQLKMALLAEEERGIPQRRNDLIQQYSQVIQKIIAEHPGYTWDPNRSALVPLPKAPEKAAVPAPKPAAAPAAPAKTEKK